MKHILREPLVQFLLLGTILFVVFHFVGQLNLEKPAQIVVTPERIKTLQDGFKFDFGKQPTEEETEKLIQDYIREEVLVQEAVRAELHLEDQKVRAQLKLRMEDLPVPVATDAELEQFLKDNPDRFRSAPDKPIPPLSQIRPTVQSVWNAAKRKEILDAEYQKALGRYTIRIERPKTPATTRASG